MPDGATTVEQLTERLRRLQAWSGMSYRTIHREVVRDREARGVPERPVMNTVYRCFQPGRARLDVDLVVDIARLLLRDDVAAERWRHTCLLVAGLAGAAAIVSVTGSWPDDPGVFTGRRDDLQRIVGSDDTRGWVISGMPGVGKTRLAVHAGHLLMAAGRFTDVQLAVDLRGYHPDRPPADPNAVLDGFLRRLGVPSEHIQHLDLAGRASRFRELLAGRSALVLLDNAASAEQVRPLLPDDPGSFVLITSRRRLHDVPSVRPLLLDVLPADEAVNLLRQAAGAAVDTDPGAAEEITALLGRLPLALDVVAGRVRANPDWALSDHLERLQHHRRSLRLDTGVELAISQSYRDLAPAWQRAFRLLALHPGADLTAPAVAALTGADPDQARDDLDQLAAVSLLQQPAPARYRFHDLIRTYAAARTHDEDPAGARRAALTRLGEHYLHTSALAVDLIYPHERDHRPQIPQPGTPQPLPDPEAARAWLEAERANLLAAATHPDLDGMLLAGILHRYLAVTGRYTDARLLHEHVVARAQQRGEVAAEARALLDLGEIDVRTAQYDQAIDHVQRAVALPGGLTGPIPTARALRYLAMANQFTGRYDRATGHLEHAIEVSREAGDRTGEASALGNLGVIHQLSGRYEAAAEHHRQALAVFDALDAVEDKARALNHLGTLHRLAGRYAEAASHHRRALALLTDVRALEGMASAHDHLGVALRLTGRHEQALEHHRQALELSRRIGDPDDEARALDNLGDLYLATGRPDLAVEHHDHALRLYRDLGDPGGQSKSLNGLGEAARATGDLRAALTAHAEAHTHADKIGHQQEQARACDGLAHAHHERGDSDQAREQWRQALALYEELGVPEADGVRGHLSELDG